MDHKPASRPCSEGTSVQSNIRGNNQGARCVPGRALRPAQRAGEGDRLTRTRLGAGVDEIRTREVDWVCIGPCEHATSLGDEESSLLVGGYLSKTVLLCVK